MAFLNYHHLRYFWVAVKEGGITRASRKLNVSQPTISSQIRELENVLDQPLVNRESNRLALTDAGRLVYRYAEQIFSLGGELMDALQERPTGKPLGLAVGLVNSVPKLLAHRLLEPALALPEGVHLQCFEDRLERLLSDLVDHHLDIVITDSPIPPSSKARAYNHALGESGVLFFGSERLAAAHRPGFPRSLDGAPLFLPTKNTSLRRSLDGWFAARQIRPRVVGEFEDPALLKVFGEAGGGIFPALAVVEADIRRLCDVRVLGVADGVGERFYALSVERRLKHRAVAAILEAARHRLLA